jgi:hypothetical protein
VRLAGRAGRRGAIKEPVAELEGAEHRVVSERSIVVHPAHPSLDDDALIVDCVELLGGGFVHGKRLRQDLEKALDLGLSVGRVAGGGARRAPVTPAVAHERG